MSKIEWTDKVWNPVTGCTRASAGCDNCCAVKMTKRLQEMGDKKYIGLINDGKSHFNGVVKCHEDVLAKPFSWKKPCRVFVNSMSDLFHKDVPFEFIDKAFAVMALCPQHTFQILTKRPERMEEYFMRYDHAYFSNMVFANALRHIAPEQAERYRNASIAVQFPLPNVWLGTSVENQEAADARIPHLLKCPAAVRFLSVEPQIGTVDIEKFLFDRCSKCGGECGYYPYFDPEGHEDCKECDGTGVDTDYTIDEISWVICGGESGPNARPFDVQWALSCVSVVQLLSMLDTVFCALLLSEPSRQ